MEVIAACHIHSEWSYDGSWTLPALAKHFLESGRRVVMMTEHDRGFTEARFQEFRQACSDASCETILVVPGIEYSDAENRIHVLVWGLDSFLGENLPTNDMLDRVKEANGVAVLAHPTRKNAWQSFEPHWAERLLAIEAWNRKYDGWAPSQTSPDLLRRGKQLPFVGLDFHSAKQHFPLNMALDLDGPINERTVVQTFRDRRCEARAFGRPLTNSVLARSFALLSMAEKGRRTAAKIVKSTKRAAVGGVGRR